MNEAKKSNGCTLATILIALAVLVLLAIPVSLFGLFALRARHAKEQAHVMREEHASRSFAEAHTATSSHEENQGVTFTAESLRRYSASEIGDELTRDHFAARMADSNATALSRQTFIQKANGRTVRWRLRTCEVHAAEDSGPLRATFDLPYSIQVAPSAWSGSSVQISADFPPTELQRLARLRRNDWANIEGRLEIRENNTTLLHEGRVID